MKSSEREHLLRAIHLSRAFSILALIVAVVGVGAALRSLERSERAITARVEATEREIRARIASEIRQCRRVQRVRDQENAGARTDFILLSTAAEAPSPRQPVYANLMRQVAFTPPTDCRQAILNPLIYRAPEPIRFADCAEPPPSTFEGCPRKRQ